jgi:hypothetical protein
VCAVTVPIVLRERQSPGGSLEVDLQAAMSWLAYDSTAYGWSIWLLYGAVLKNVDDGPFEVVLRGAGPLLSNLDVAVVDAAVIDGAKSFRASALGNQDRRFGRDFGVGEGDELVLRVEKDMFFGAIGRFMLTHGTGGFTYIGIDKPKHYVLPGKFAFEALYLRKVAIGDGTVGCDK